MKWSHVCHVSYRFDLAHALERRCIWLLEEICTTEMGRQCCFFKKSNIRMKIEPISDVLRSNSGRKLSTSISVSLHNLQPLNEIPIQ